MPLYGLLHLAGVYWRAAAAGAAAIIRPHHRHRERELLIAQMLLSGPSAASVVEVSNSQCWYVSHFDSRHLQSGAWC